MVASNSNIALIKSFGHTLKSPLVIRVKVIPSGEVEE